MSDDIETTPSLVNMASVGPAAESALTRKEDSPNGARTPTIGEPSFALDDPAKLAPAIAASLPGRSSGRGLDELEERIRRLEEQYAALQDTKVMEERVVQRVSRRLRRNPSTAIREGSDALPMSETTSSALPEEPALAPAALARTEEAVSAPVAKPAAEVTMIAPVAKPMDVPVATPLITPVAVSAAPVPPAGPPAAAASRLFSLDWLQTASSLIEMLNEMRVMLRMVVDPRYHMTWMSRLVPLPFFAVFIFSDWESLKAFFPWTILPAVGGLINKAIILLLGFVTFKTLTREVRRYQYMIPDAPGAKTSDTPPWA